MIFIIFHVQMAAEIPLYLGWDHHKSDSLYKFKAPEDFPIRVNSKIVFTDLSNNAFSLPIKSEFGQIYGGINRWDGKKHLITSSTYDFLQQLQGQKSKDVMDLIKTNATLFRNVVHAGVIIPENYSNAATWNSSFGKYDILNEWIVLNKDCVSACNYCFAGQSNPHKEEIFKDIPARMPSHVMKQIVADMPASARAIDANHIHLKFGGGGEPAQAADEVFEFLDIVNRDLPAEYTYDWVLITSGIGLNQRKLEEIKKRNGYIALSVGGDQEGHDRSRPFANGRGSYDIVMNTLRRIKSLEIPHNLTLVLTDDNIATAYRLLETMYDDPDIGWSPVITSIGRDHSNSNGNNFIASHEKLIAGWKNFLRVMLEGSIKFKQPIPPNFDYVEIGPRKRHTCIAGVNYITAASIIDPNEKNKIKPLISSCHVNATDTKHATIPTKGERYLDVADYTFNQYRSYKSDRAFQSNETHCVDCGINGWCSGSEEAGGCAIQKKDHETFKPPYCETYADATELLLQAILLSDLHNGFTDVI